MYAIEHKNKFYDRKCYHNEKNTFVKDKNNVRFTLVVSIFTKLQYLIEININFRLNLLKKLKMITK